jgi:hypothetical protein
MMMIVLARKKMTIDKITVNLYTCCKCNYQWPSWNGNGNQRADGGLILLNAEMLDGIRDI